MILFDSELATESGQAELAAAAEPAEPADQRTPLPAARTLSRFLAEAQTAVRLKGEVTAMITTDAVIRRLNRQFRGKNKATDVLSFPAGGIGAEEMAGELAISAPTALRQARAQGHPLRTEIKVLLLHGLLHLAGFDHETDEGQMARRERLLRARLGLPQGLIERAEQSATAPVHRAKSTAAAKSTAQKSTHQSKKAAAKTDSAATHAAQSTGHGATKKAVTKKKAPAATKAAAGTRRKTAPAGRKTKPAARKTGAPGPAHPGTGSNPGSNF